MKNIILLVTITLCVSCSPKLIEANIELPKEYLYHSGFDTSQVPLREQWWLNFEDSTLDSLIAIALRENRDLEAAANSVEQARLYRSVARAEFLPSLSFDSEAEILHEEQTTTKEYTVAPAIEWEVSLFGELRNAKKSAAAALLKEEWNLRGVTLSLTAEVATAYFTLLQYQRSLQIATHSFELRRKATALVDSMFRYGMSNGTDLMQAKSLVYTAKIEMERYKRAVATTSLSLSTLLGVDAQKFHMPESETSLSNIALPVDIPVGLPSSLLERRPDVMKSYYSMEQAAASVGIARAKRYPSISLTAEGGLFATSLKGLTSGNPLLWSTTGELSAPIFGWRALRNKEHIALSEYNAAVAEYEQSILEALSDVEGALITINTYSTEAVATAALVLANNQIAQNTSALYTSGLGDYLSVIDAERELYASQISLIGIVAQQYINYVDLIKALGGGW
ncbi:MAG: efflux transporter outer membrane subunit [Rikenellaceae bacterium]